MIGEPQSIAFMGKETQGIAFMGKETQGIASVRDWVRQEGACALLPLRQWAALHRVARSVVRSAPFIALMEREKGRAAKHCVCTGLGESKENIGAAQRKAIGARKERNGIATGDSDYGKEKTPVPKKIMWK